MKYLVLSILIVLIYSSCQQVYEEPLPSLEGIDVDWNLHRFGEQLSAAASDGVQADELHMLEGEYSKFYNIYFDHILPIRGDDPESMAENLTGFYRDSSIVGLVDKVNMVHGDLSEVKDGLNEAFRYMKYYMPCLLYTSGATKLGI